MHCCMNNCCFVFVLFVAHTVGLLDIGRGLIFVDVDRDGGETSPIKNCLSLRMRIDGGGVETCIINL